MAPTQNPNPNSHHHHHLLLLLLLATSLPTIFSIPYTSHCSTPSAAVDDAGAASGDPLPSFQIPTGYFSGGGAAVFGPDPSFLPRSFSFNFRRVLPRTTPSLVHLSATLTLSGGRSPLPGRHLLSFGGGHLHRLRPGLPRLIGRRASVSFDLNGYWSAASGLLCMVGTGAGRAADGSSVRFSAVLHLNFPKLANLNASFITGRLESAEADGGGFEPISLVAYAEEGYEYKRAAKASCPLAGGGGARNALQVFNSSLLCFNLRLLLRTGYRLEYGNNSSSSLGLHQSFMNVNQMHCSDDGAVRAYMVFSNQTLPPYHYFLVGEQAVVAEGFWDKKTSRLCLTGCRVVSSGASRADLSVGECGIGISFWFPSVWSIRERSFAAGLIWNESRGSDAGKSSMISASSIGNFRGDLAGVKYNYTKVDEAKKYYLKAGFNKKRKGRFPDGNSYRDFEFQFFLKENGSGYASLVTIGSMIFDRNSLLVQDRFSRPLLADMNQRLLNVSYDIRHVVSRNSSVMVFEQQQISAEGVYDTKTGSLCMVACREVDGFLDCEVLISVQFASLDVKAREHLKGTISSLRKKTDPLFFDSLAITSYGMYIEQVDESIWRMDMESTMVLISMTLSCVFIVLQLFHVKKNPGALPSTSMIMLLILALGYMIPLVLNFEALFMSRSKQTVLLSSGGWLEVNEVIVRVITMIGFLLQLRFLQLAWSGRSVDGSKEELWAAEKNALWICLPLYFLGGVITWIVHMGFNHAQRKLIQVARFSPVEHTLWEDLVSYGGLILDGFLLPQVILNAFSDYKTKALAPLFYVGTTIIRALPHVYDAFRTKHFVPSLRPSYIYASPSDDLFNLAWDIVIPCGAILLSVLLYLQQRFGGAFFLCSKNRKSSEYEMISTVSS